MGLSGQLQRIPMIDFVAPDSNREFVYGSGWTIRDAPAIQDRLASRLYRLVWSGKVFQKIPNSDIIQLYNFFPGLRKVDGTAIVYHGPSVLDGNNNGTAVLLDYRNNMTKDSEIRDELREVKWKGQLSKIYIGRLYRFNGPVEEIRTSAWDDITKYDYDFTFLLDARDEIQDTVPRWALRHTCCGG